MINRKAQINTIPMLIITMVLVGIIVALGLVVMDKFSSSVKETDTITNSTFTNNTAVGYYPITRVSNVYCNSSLEIGIDNVTYTSTLIMVGGGVGFGCGNWSGTWLFDANNTATTSLTSSIDAIAPITSDWLPIVIIVAVVGVILALIAFAFSRFGRG